MRDLTVKTGLTIPDLFTALTLPEENLFPSQDQLSVINKLKESGHDPSLILDDICGEGMYTLAARISDVELARANDKTKTAASRFGVDPDNIEEMHKLRNILIDLRN